MKQILQSFKTGKTELVEVPTPKPGKGKVLIQTTNSLVSLGTERMLVEFGKASLVEKARQQPDKVKMVLDKMKAEGVLPTLEAVFNKLEQPIPLGYCNVGKVVELGAGVHHLQIDDRVVSNGPHAEFVTVPKNLVAKIPSNVTDEQAAFTVISSIGLQGIRLCQPTFGETIVVVGLGLIGLLTAQLLKAHGCQVIGTDVDESKCELAQKLGITALNTAKSDPVKTVLQKTKDTGADAVIITASAKSDTIISQSAQMSRKRGRIVLVGVIGLNLSRADFYEKELTFQVSCSYGPGRYDDDYEQKGLDYPIGFVRWTEQRNFEAVLSALSNGSLVVDPMISEIVALEEFDKIYNAISDSSKIASLLKYPGVQPELGRSIALDQNTYNDGSSALGIIGAGNFTKMTLLPALVKTGVKIKYLVSENGVNGTVLAKKYNIPNSSTDYKELLDDEHTNTVLITTRHNSHAKLALESLSAGKNVFLEKPLALSQQDVERIQQSLGSNKKGWIQVGFNRRFSPHIRRIKETLGKPGPINIIANMNAGNIPGKSWVHDMEIGGGRIIGEACHLMDLCVYLSDSSIKAVCAHELGVDHNDANDNVSILLSFENGSNATINYFSNGSKAYSKERLEVYAQERTWVMDNYRKTVGYGVKGFKSLKTKLDKGHQAQFQSLARFIEHGGTPPIPVEDIINVTRASISAIDSLKEGQWISVH